MHAIFQSWLCTPDHLMCLGVCPLQLSFRLARCLLNFFFCVCVCVCGGLHLEVHTHTHARTRTHITHSYNPGLAVCSNPFGNPMHECVCFACARIQTGVVYRDLESLRTGDPKRPRTPQGREVRCICCTGFLSLAVLLLHTVGSRPNLMITSD